MPPQFLPRRTQLCRSILPLSFHVPRVRSIGSTSVPKQPAIPHTTANQVPSLEYLTEEDQQKTLRKITREDLESRLYSCFATIGSSIQAR